MLGLLFTLALTAYGVGYGWMNPVAGLMVYYCFAVLRPPYLWFWSVGQTGGRFMFLVAAATILGWLLKGMGDWSKIKHVKWPLIGLTVYILAGLFTYQFTAIDKEVAWTYLNPQIKTVAIVLLALTLFTQVRHVKLFAWIVTLSFGYLAFSLNERYLQNPGFLYFNGFGGIDNNGTAMVMVMGVPLALLMGLHVRNWFMKGVCFFSVLCLIHVVLFSFSRGGQLGLIIVGMMTFVAVLAALPRKMLTMALGVVMLAAALHLAGPEVRHEFWTIFADPEERDVSAASRFDTWSAGWQCMLEHPLGVGPRNFNLIAHQYGLSRGKSIHNLYLQTGADYGFIGLGGLVLFYFGTAWQTFTMSMSATARQLGWPRHFGQMVTISLSGLAICSVFIGMETVEHGFIVAALGLCSVAYVRDLAHRERLHQLEPVPEQVDLAGPQPALA